MSHIVEGCALTKLNGGLSRLHSADDVPHCRSLCPDKTEWWLISATLCRWRRCFVADQLWFMTRIWEEESTAVCYRHHSSWQPGCRTAGAMLMIHMAIQPSARVTFKAVSVCAEAATWQFLKRGLLLNPANTVVLVGIGTQQDKISVANGTDIIGTVECHSTTLSSCLCHT